MPSVFDAQRSQRLTLGGGEVEKGHHATGVADGHLQVPGLRVVVEALRVEHALDPTARPGFSNLPFVRPRIIHREAFPTKAALGLPLEVRGQPFSGRRCTRKRLAVRGGRSRERLAIRSGHWSSCSLATLGFRRAVPAIAPAKIAAMPDGHTGLRSSSWSVRPSCEAVRPL